MLSSLLAVSRHCHAVQWYNIEQSTSVRLACYTVYSFVGLIAATQFSASEFLKNYETEFFEVINPRLSLLRLVRKGVITEDVKSDINTSNTDDAREVLYHHLTLHANVDTLKEYLVVAIAAGGYPKMQSLGRKMMEELEQGGWLELCAYLWGGGGGRARVCVCVCMCGICTLHVLCVAASKMGLPLSCGPHPTPPTPSHLTHTSPLSSLPSLHPLMSTHCLPFR